MTKMALRNFTQTILTWTLKTRDILVVAEWQHSRICTFYATLKAPALRFHRAGDQQLTQSQLWCLIKYVIRLTSMKLFVATKALPINAAMFLGRAMFVDFQEAGIAAKASLCLTKVVPRFIGWK
ncbi:hypothetical protein EBI00_02545 [Marinomonas hwangdonensis]|uniref:Uncharacterized protein n=1 Tax=Marinomonas hwangdonensis TaxID=1053647 RepID=A0A3M8QAC9_9GAMM|nr:hypothetical protein EBI00_02545 [Marinomonas hwangdonensis]